MFKRSILAAAVLAAAVSVHAETLGDSGSWGVGSHEFTATEITGGTFERTFDGIQTENGVNKTTNVSITGEKGLTITGGTFKTTEPRNLVRINKVAIDRGYNIGLVKKYDINFKPYETVSAGGSAPHEENYYTVEEAKAIFEKYANDPEKLKAYFLSADTENLPADEREAVEARVPTLEEVIGAIEARKMYEAIATGGEDLLGWHFVAETGDLNVKGGNFVFNSVNANTFEAKAGKLVWDGGVLTKTEGAGRTTLSGENGVDILSGSIRVMGSDAEGAFALRYDYRDRQDRDRWTVGQYLDITAGNGNGIINIGREGSATGPEIYFSEGQMNLNAAHTYLHSGSLTIEGQYRSTMLSGDITVGQNGTLTVITGDSISRNQIDSPSMTLGAVTVDGGTLNLHNAQLGGVGGTIHSGTVNLTGNSGLCNPTIDSGTFNISNKSFIGAIKGDSKVISPYPTSTTNVTINGGTFNFDVLAPSEGTTLIVGVDDQNIQGEENIGGIHATEANSVISISDSAVFNFNVAGLTAGETYTADGFISNKSETGKIVFNGSTTDKLFYKADITADGDLTIVMKDTSEAVSTLTGESYLAKNAAAFGAIAASGSGLAAARIAEIWQMTDADDAAANAAVARDLRDVTNPGSAAGMFGMKNSADVIGAEVFNQASLATGVYDNTTGKRIWGTAVGDWGRVNGNSDFDIDTAGVVFGADHTFDQTVRAGFAFGALHTSSDGEGAKYTGDSYWVGMYGSWKLPMNFPLVLDADALYGWTDGDIDTSLLGSSGSADVDGDVIRVSAHASMPFELSVASVVPYIGLEWTRVSQDGYTDGKLGRSVDSLDEDALTMPVGVKFVKTIENGSALFKGTMDVAYARDLTDFDPRLTTAYGAATIDSESADIGKDAFRFGLGVDCHLNDAWTIGAKYKLEVRDNFTDNQLKATVQFAW